MTKKIFLTFANTSFMSTSRIANEALQLNIFDKILEYNENSIPDFINKHKEFINNNPAGYGNFIWKPKIIFDTLLNMNENEILIYADSGFHININGIPRLHYYLEKLENDDNHIVVFSTNESYKAKQYVKMDAIMHLYPNLNNECQDMNLIYAGLMIIKKNNKTINLIQDWLNLCENYSFINTNSSIYHYDAPYFKGNDKDNGLFNLCLAKHKISFAVYPDEINIYKNGCQIIHIEPENLHNIDWSELNDKPFQARRLTPLNYNL